MRLLLALVLALSVSACTAKSDTPTAEPKKAATSTPTPSTPDEPAPSTAPDPSTQPDMSDTKACAEVRAGIDDFNAGEFAGTVEHFRTALPLAEKDAKAHPSRAAQDLVDAVTYYAELAPADYPASAGSSLEFAKYKAITLGQCVVGTEPDDPNQAPSESPGVPA